MTGREAAERGGRRLAARGGRRPAEQRVIATEAPAGGQPPAGDPRSGPQAADGTMRDAVETRLAMVIRLANATLLTGTWCISGITVVIMVAG